MRRKLYWLAVGIFIMIAFAMLPVSISAQSFWLEHSGDKAVALELIKPSLKDVNLRFVNGRWYPMEHSSSSLAFFLSLRWPISSKTLFVAELPYVRAEFETTIAYGVNFERQAGSENTPGSPYLGLEIGSKASSIWFEAGVRLPLMKKDFYAAADFGVESDPDRAETFRDFATLKILANYRLRLRSGFGLRLRGGPLAMRDFDHFGDEFWAFAFDVWPGYETSRLSIGGSSIARAQYTHRNQGFDFRANQRIGFSASADLDRLRPGVYVSPGSALGLNLGIRLGKS